MQLRSGIVMNFHVLPKTCLVTKLLGALITGENNFYSMTVFVSFVSLEIILPLSTEITFITLIWEGTHCDFRQINFRIMVMHFSNMSIEVTFTPLPCHNVNIYDQV